MKDYPGADWTFMQTILMRTLTLIDAKKNEVTTVAVDVKKRRADRIEGLQKLADTFNKTRDTLFAKLPSKLKKRGDFDTMEIVAQVHVEDGKPPELWLTGVWGSVGSRIRHEDNGTYTVRESGTETWKPDQTVEDLLELFARELACEHPEHGDAVNEIVALKKRYV